MSLQQNKDALFGNKGKSAGSVSASANTSVPAVSRTTDISVVPISATQGSKTAGITFKGTTAASSAQSLVSKQKKIVEAQEFSEKAQQALKTSMFQWKPDHLSASSHFEKASELYKQAGELKNALLLMIQASESNEALGAMGAAGLCKYKAAQLAKEMGDAAQNKKLLLEAANLYGIHGDLTKYTELLAQLAGEEEDGQPQFAFKHYMKAIDRLVPADTPKDYLAKAPSSVLDVLRSAFSFLLRQRRFPDALKLAGRMCSVYEAMELETSLCKTMLAITVLQLAMGDAVQVGQRGVPCMLWREGVRWG
ncbi:hypothetical protein EON64_16130 [archaeon]|nr:MAG: hypothetical protein EON64_16130 [archaeon]